ncbi:MAG: hypothetical protein ACR2G4_17515 [Pyrinomonadaceae bacterium]
MTGEEMERAIEFLLQGQADHQVRLDQLTQQIAETNRQLQTYAETQSEFIGIMSRNVDALTTAQAQTDARLNKLIGLFEQHIVAGH